MRTPASIAHHPIHPMLVPLPLGLWLFSLVCDVIYRFGPGDTVWYTVASYNLAAGILGALLAALFGLVDLRAVPPAARRTALMHMAINLFVIALYIVNAWLRLMPGPYSDLPFVLSLAGIALLGVSGWLGGHLVYVLGVGVREKGEEVRP